MNIREASLGDAAAIAQVHVDSWRSTYRGIIPDTILAELSYEQRERQWEETVGDTEQREFVYVAENPATGIIGFASGGAALDKSDQLYKGELFSIYIQDAYQHQGLGRRLFLRVVERLIQMKLTSMLIWVLAENPARGFYETLGGRFVKTGSFEIGGKKIEQVAYGWADITRLISSHC